MTKDKLELVGISKGERRVEFVFKKSTAFFKQFLLFMESLDLEKTGSFYGFEEGEGLFLALQRDGNMDELSDIVENTSNNNYDMDIFYGKDKIIVVIRTKKDKQQLLLQELKKIAVFKGEMQP